MMTANSIEDLNFYADLLSDIKQRIQQGQTRAALSANAEMLMTYWDIGYMLCLRQQEEGWGAGVIPRLSKDLRNDLPEVKGFSERNLKRMAQFYREYPGLSAMGPQPVAQLGPGEKPDSKELVTTLTQSTPEWLRLVFRVSWTHNILLIQKLKDLDLRRWYLEQTIANGWGRDTLAAMLKSNAHERQGSGVSNFEDRLPSPQSELAQQLLKDPFQFDFLTLTEPFREQELEAGLVAHLEKFLLELELENLDGLAKLTGLVELHCSRCRSLKSIDGLEKLARLEALFVCGCDVLERFDVVERLPKIKRLSLPQGV